MLQANITLFIPLCGRVAIWREYLAPFLTNQTWKHSSIRLAFCDTSGNREFGDEIKDWLNRSDYQQKEYFAFPCDKPTDDLTLSNLCCDIYNLAATLATTQYMWIVEDDVIPPLNAAMRLISNFDERVGSVSGVYQFKADPTRYMAWVDDTYHLIRREREKESVEQVQAVRGNGFGCVMVRSSQLYGYTFPHFDKLIPSFDHTFYDQMRMRKLIDWTVMCQHLGIREW